MNNGETILIAITNYNDMFIQMVLMLRYIDTTYTLMLMFNELD